MKKSSLRIGDFETPLTRREWLTLAACGVAAGSMSGWLENLAAAEGDNPQRRRACILLWMAGGPSQIDTFDLKPGHANGGPFREIRTNADGVRISEHLPKLARLADKMAIVRSMSTREGDHGRATYYLRTGYLEQGAIQYPTLGSLVSKELGNDDSPLPNFVSIAPFRAFNSAAFGPGFLGPRYAPLIVGDSAGLGRQPGDYDQALRVPDLTAPAELSEAQVTSRLGILRQMEEEFVRNHPGVSARSHQTAYERAVRLMRTEAARAFDLDGEPAELRDRYGRNLFGQGCLLARRLVERGVPFIEISLGSNPSNPIGWDTHGNNFDTVRQLSGVLDNGWGTLMEDLQDRGLLETTTIVWMGEFGRTPQINNNNGRDHYPNAWSTVLAGGGIRGGQAYGGTSADGTRVEGDNPTEVPDLIATVCRAVGLNPLRQNMSNVGRPIRLADPTAEAIREILS